MSLCNVDGLACDCQPDEDQPCTRGVEQRKELARLRAENAKAREILAGGDYGSLPNDWTVDRIADARMDDINKLTWQVRDTCQRAEKAENERDSLRSQAEALTGRVGELTRYLTAGDEENDALQRRCEGLENGRPVLLALARRCLWIAYAWNDHNFDAAHICAKQEAVAAGIASFDQANEWIEGMCAALAGETTQGREG